MFSSIPRVHCHAPHLLIAKKTASGINENPDPALSNSSDPLMNISQRIPVLKNLVSNEKYCEAFKLCINTSDDFPFIARTAWFGSVLDFLSSVPPSYHTETWYGQMDVIRGFSLMEILRLTSQTSCLSDFRNNLAELDLLITKLNRTKDQLLLRLVDEMKLRLWFFMAAYLLRLSKKKPLRTNIHLAAKGCYQQACNVNLSPPTVDHVLCRPTWERIYAEGLSLQLQSLLLKQSNQESSGSWLTALFDALDQDSGCKMSKFDYLHSFEPAKELSHNKTGSTTDRDLIYFQYLDHRPEDLNLILWFLLRPTPPDPPLTTKICGDLVLTQHRLKYILRTIAHVFSDTPFSANGLEACQLDLIVFLTSLTLAYSIRYASSADAMRNHATNAPIAWSSQPLCLITSRILPSGAHQGFWSDMCRARGKKTPVSGYKFYSDVDQLRFKLPIKSISPRMVLRVARAISVLPLDSNQKEANECAVSLWDSGLTSLVQHPDFSHCASPVPQSHNVDDSALFPSELVSDWWMGTHVDNLPNVTAQDHSWFFLAWHSLGSYWIENPPSTIEPLLRHICLLSDEKLPSDPECALLAGKLANKAIANDRNSMNSKSLGTMVLEVLEADSIGSTSLTKGSIKSLSGSIEAEITSLRKLLGFPQGQSPATGQPLEAANSDFQNPINMRSGYGSYSNGGGGKASGLGLLGTPSSRASGVFSNDDGSGYRVSRSSNVTPAPAVAPVSAAPCNNQAQPAFSVSDVQTKLMSQMIDQWVSVFTDFSRLIADTSAELAKSRIQNEELSRLLRDTRTQMDTLVEEQKKNQQLQQPANQLPKNSPTPKPPSGGGHSFEDWRAVQEALRDVASSLRDFRAWLPTVMAAAQTAVASSAPPMMLAPPRGDILSHMALAQLAALQQQQQQAALVGAAAQQTSSAGNSLLLGPAAAAAPTQQQIPRDFLAQQPALPMAPSPFFAPAASAPVLTMGQSVSGRSTRTPQLSFAPTQLPSPDTRPLFAPAPSTTGVPAAIFPATQKKDSTPLVFDTTQPSLPSFCLKSQLNATPEPATTTAAKTVAPRVAPVTATTTKTSSLFNFGVTSLAKPPTSPNSVAAAAIPPFSFMPKPPPVDNTTLTTIKSLSPRIPVGRDADEDDASRPEAFVPTADFVPCVDKLPELVKAVTGEEGELELFCQRARLFRWDKTDGGVGEWKTRGNGELKILADEANHKYRIVMRRDQIMKLCANHYILPGINMKRHQQSASTCMWTARDFAVMDADTANPTGNDELFMVRFKTDELATEFYDTVATCLDKVLIDPRPQQHQELASTKMKEPGAHQKGSPGLGKLKAKAGNWICGTCAISVDRVLSKCPACDTSKPHVSSVAAAPTGLDRLKPRTGSWCCPTCALSAPPDTDKCLACQTPKPGAQATAAPSFTINFAPSSSTSKGGLVFGVAATSNAAGGSISSEQPKFHFGTPISPPTTAPTPKFSFGVPEKSGERSVCGGTFASLDLTKGLSKSEAKKPESGFTFSLTTPSAISTISSAKKEVTPVKTQHVDEEEDEVDPCDHSQLNFAPIVDRLPDKVEVRTGEEDEEVIFEARAKLFRFDDGSWKERGLGQLKLLRTPETNHVRVVMRREQVHKVCCNHVISSVMELKDLEGGTSAAVKPCAWWAVDFSDVEEVGPEGRKEMFSVRFKTPEESAAFRDAFVAAAKAAGGVGAAASDDLDDDDDDIEILKGSLVSEDQKERAKALLLPEDFYVYELRSPADKARRWAHCDQMTPKEEAEEDALLEAALGGRSTKSVADCSSLVEAEDSETNSPQTPVKPSWGALRGKPGSWDCGGCALRVDPSLDKCPACSLAREGKPTATTPATHTTPAPDRSLFGSGLGSGGSQLGAFGGLFHSSAAASASSGLSFGALNSDQRASDKPAWLSTPASSTNTWSTSCTPLFAATASSAVAAGDDHADNSCHDADPDPQFEPIIPLPELVETKTGEEDEIPLFLRRCKLYRLIENQWKERGVGDMKVLVQPKQAFASELVNSRTELPTNQDLPGGINYARLLMRRDQVLKICANHTISPEVPQFKPLQISNTSICWVTKDFSENSDGEIMTLSMKFKTEQDLSQFHAAVERARKMLQIRA